MKYKSNENLHLERRGLINIILTSAVVLFLVVNLVDLQIVEGAKYYLIASRTNQSKVKLVAPRGIIYDSKGNKIVYNSLSYSVYIMTDELGTEDEENVLSQVASILNKNKDDLYKIYKTKAYDENLNKRNGIRVTIDNSLTYDTYLVLLNSLDKLSTFGVYVNSEPMRYYERTVSLSNIIGYVGDPDANDIKNGIYSESQVGKDGLERYYDSYLRGKEGIEIYERDPLTRGIKTYLVQDVKSGNSINLTIDKNWQDALYTTLKNRAIEVNAFAGSGVIVNSKTGEVKAMVTYPGYDSNKFARGISYSDYQALINDVRMPLFNRAIALQLPPGSTWKVIGATAALESGVINESSTYYSNRCIELPGKINFCEADKAFLGTVNVVKALGYSSNIFFCEVAMKMNLKYAGPDYLLKYGQQYGLGEKTGIDLYGEASGTLPSQQLKIQKYHEPWYIGDDCNTVIGQGLVTVTPLQMAMVTSAISNGGEIMKPYLVSSITDSDGNNIKEFMPEMKRKIEASPETLEIIKKGMRLSVVNGTASALRDSPVQNLMAKTGSSDASEIINGVRYSGAHSWTIGCFDYEGENYCFTVMLQWGGRGFKSVTVMKNFINCLYSNFKGYCTN